MITIPLALVLTVVGYVVVHRLRLRVARRSAVPDFATVLPDSAGANVHERFLRRR